MFRPWSARDTFVWAGIVDDETAHAAALAEQLGSRPTGLLHYPLAPLRCAPPARLPNILVIGLDAMRPDAVDPRIAPNIERFAQRAIRFEQHWSGGNGTRVGLFSLFYALPPTYWKEFYSEQRSPVLIDELQAAGYQLGIFPGNPPDKIVGLDRTAFRNVPDADLVATRGDAKIASGWIHWLEQRDPARPFFGFLFFESAPGGCREELPAGDASSARARRRWRSAAPATTPRSTTPTRRRARCSTTSSGAGSLDDTIVIVTSDHGQEFDENGLGFHGHGSSYSPLSAPHALHRALAGSRRPGVVAAAPPTTTSRRPCSRDVLGCANPPSDYSSGGNLFSGPEWELAGRGELHRLRGGGAAPGHDQLRASTSRPATRRTTRVDGQAARSTATCCSARFARPAASIANERVQPRRLADDGGGVSS